MKVRTTMMILVLAGGVTRRWVLFMLRHRIFLHSKSELTREDGFMESLIFRLNAISLEDMSSL